METGADVTGDVPPLDPRAAFTGEELGDAFAAFADEALDWAQLTVGAAVDVDALLAGLDPELADPGDCPWGSFNLAWFDADGRLHQPPRKT